MSQLISEEAIANLPLSGRDFRDLAQLSPNAQVVPGLRGGMRLGGQQSDYTGLMIDGGDSRDNFFGEFFGSLETKNFTIPLEAVQEFQVVTNGFAPEFGRSTGGLLNVVTKSGTNQTHGSAHYFYRGKSLTADDALGVAPNIDNQHQFGASIGGAIKQDKQFYFLAFDVQRQSGPLVTKFARDVSGVPATEWGIADLGDLEGSNPQEQNLFTILAKYDIQAGDNDRISIRTFYTDNKTDGFTGGRGQNQIQASFGNTEKFRNNGHNSVATWNKVLAGGRGFNELKVSYYDSDRPRDPNNTIPEIVISDTGTFGQRFFLPIFGKQDKLTIQDNFQYVFGNHDVKFGADYNSYAGREGAFFGWSAGSYLFGTLEDFQAGTPFAWIGGFGFNGQPYAEAATDPNRAYQRGYGFYAQDKWQAGPNLSITYGLRYDGTTNQQPNDTNLPLGGQTVWSGVGADSVAVPKPQGPPNDWKQWGPRLGLAYSFDVGDKPCDLPRQLGALLRPDSGHLLDRSDVPGTDGRQLLLLQPGLHARGRLPEPRSRQRAWITLDVRRRLHLRRPRGAQPARHERVGHARAEPVAGPHVVDDVRVREVGFPADWRLQQHAVESQLHQRRHGSVRAHDPRTSSRPDTGCGAGSRQLQSGTLPSGRVQPEPALRERLPVLRQLRLVEGTRTTRRPSATRTRSSDLKIRSTSTWTTGVAASTSRTSSSSRPRRNWAPASASAGSSSPAAACRSRRTSSRTRTGTAWATAGSATTDP